MLVYILKCVSRHGSRCLPALLALLLAACCAAPAPAQQPPPATPQAMQAAIAAVKPALVKIHVVTADYSSGREVKEEAFGSGVIISPEGYVIANHHVAGDATYITCTLADKTEIDAHLVGTDALTDIAVLKLNPETARTFPTRPSAIPMTLQVGDRVFAMGSPLAFSQSVTMGVISNTELVMPETFADSFTLDGEDVASVVRWIGHDAQIYPGNSGGPLVNMRGEIVGINEVSFGLSGAIPGNLACVDRAATHRARTHPAQLDRPVRAAAAEILRENARHTDHRRPRRLTGGEGWLCHR